eukprot:Nk52_evm24s675 gene=Nk52_evmTU24s675
MSSITLNRDTYEKRISKLYAYWKSSAKEGIFRGADALVFGVGQSKSFQRISAFQIWLFGYEFPDIVMVCTEKAVYILASSKKIAYFEQLQNESAEIELKLLTRNKADGNAENFGTLLKACSESKEGKKHGVIVKDQYEGSFIKTWEEYVKKNGGDGAENVDISAALSVVLSTKDSDELTTIRESAELATAVMKNYFINEMEQVIDEEQQIKHTALSDKTEKVISEPSKVKNRLDADNVESVYAPIIQSGGKFNLKPSASSNDDNLHFGTIMCSIGTRNKSYCSNIARTFMVDPSKDQERAYEILLEIRSLVIKNLKPGTEIRSLYSGATSLIKKRNESLLEHFTPTIGFGMGLEFREAPLLMNEKNKRQIQNGMVFNLALGFSNLTNEKASKPEDRTYAVFVADTVAVVDGDARVFTPAPIKFQDVSYFFKDEDEPAEEEEPAPEPMTALRSKKGAAIIDSRLRGEDKTEKTQEELRREHQADLAKKINEQAKARLLEGATGSTVAKKNVVRMAYRDSSELPKDRTVQNLKIFVDRRHDSVVLPIYGYAVPFHISTVKNVSKTDHGEYTYLRINFYAPGTSVGAKENAPKMDPKFSYVRELFYRSIDGASMNETLRLMKEMQKKYRSSESERKEREDLVVQKDLILNRQRNIPRLNDLYMRPNITNRRLLGSLEAHVNGFRYTSVKGDRVDIIYANIRHAFFQPCENEMIVLVHFTLKNPIIIGKKKHSDIQFYTEVMEQSADVGGKRSNMYDKEELEQEQREREVKNKLNQAFANFVKKAEDASNANHSIEFDMPFRELGFYGVPFRSNVFMQPTTYCLISLVEQPPFVLTLEDVELVHFERVQFSLKNFDLVFVFKDYTKPVKSISSIPTQSLDAVKEWLDSCDIKYTEGPQNLNWPRIMKTINEDPEDFFANGGWEFLDPEAGGDGEGSEEESSEPDEFIPSEEDFESSSDSEDYESEDSESSESESGSEDEDEEEGKDWDELEAEAKRDDMRKDTGIDSPDPRRRSGGGSKHRPSHSSREQQSSGRKRHGDRDRQRPAKRRR